ncbi:MAG: hypothetical protein MI747_12210 [Desulfobacterales bacterium]|nr:hypothetical protein [Desulfobacterales bacterium]
MRSMLFYLAMGFFMTHELDAVASHEWRVLPLTAWLPDGTGYHVFILAHIPLFALMLYLIANPHPKVRTRAKAWISLFFVFHGALHLTFIGHAQYEFHSLMSQILIYGGAVFALAFLAVEWRSRDGKRPG